MSIYSTQASLCDVAWMEHSRFTFHFFHHILFPPTSLSLATKI